MTREFWGIARKKKKLKQPSGIGGILSNISLIFCGVLEKIHKNKLFFKLFLFLYSLISLFGFWRGKKMQRGDGGFRNPARAFYNLTSSNKNLQEKILIFLSLNELFYRQKICQSEIRPKQNKKKNEPYCHLFLFAGFIIKIKIHNTGNKQITPFLIYFIFYNSHFMKALGHLFLE